MKFLRIFGFFALILGFAFNGAFAETSTSGGFGTPDNLVCDDTGCTYCDGEQCYVCNTSGAECRAGCPNGQYGSGRYISEDVRDCYRCPTAYPESLFGTSGYSYSFNLYEGQCFNVADCSTSCVQYNDNAWQSYFGSAYGTYDPKLFTKDKIKFKMLGINSGCNVKTEYCVYELKDQKTGRHTPVYFMDANGTTLIDTYYVVYSGVWSTQNTTVGDSVLNSSVVYPTFQTPRAPAISGKRFIGWYDAQTGGTQRIAPASNGALYGNLTYNLASTYVGTTSRTLYARYEDVASQTYTVTYNCGSGSGTPPANGTATYNQPFYAATNTCTAPSGYEFAGWRPNGESSNWVNGTTWTFTTNKTFTAQWTAAAPTVYTVTLNPNVGSSINTIYYRNGNYYCDNAATQVIGTTYSIFNLCGLDAPNLANNTFIGYFSNTGNNAIRYIGTDGILTDAARALTISSNTTWYAHYTVTQTQITCDPGEYVPANDRACATCTVGSYCPGGTFYVPTSTQQGIYSCSTNCSGATSQAGASAVTQCFKTCNKECYKPNSNCPTSDMQCNYNTTLTVPGISYLQSNGSCGTCTYQNLPDNNETNWCPITSCPADYYFIAGEMACKVCDSGFHANAGATSPAQCIKDCSVSCSSNGIVCPDNATCTPDLNSNQQNGSVNQTQEAGTCWNNGVQIQPQVCAFTFVCNTGYEPNQQNTACVAKEYSVTYNCGNGNGTQSTDTAIYGTAYNVLNVEETNCTYPGHNFIGWVSSDNNQQYAGGDVINPWNYDGPITFTAQWGGANTYTITYEMNGGDWFAMSSCPGASGCPNTYTYGVGATINVAPTRANSEFLGWCTDASLNNCDTTQTISTDATGNKTFWAKWRCVEPYHSNSAGTACEACQDNTYWDGTQCQQCGQGDAAGFPYSKHPFTWSIKQCYRDCPDASVCRDDENLGNAFPSTCSFTEFSNSNKQVDFKGNYDAGINSCGDVAYCPYGIISCNLDQAFKPMSAPVEFHGKIPEQSLGTRYIFGKRAGSNSIDLATGNVWSQIVGPAQQTDVIYNTVGGQPVEYKYTYIFYPTYAAPNADMTGYTFNGYYYPRSGGTRYVESDYLLGATNAQSVLSGQEGDSNTARHLYATLENGGYTQNEYTITYSCGTGTGTTQTDTATYGENYTVKNNADYTDCEKPGYSFLGWVFSGDGITYNEGYVFRPWNYTNNATFTAKWNDIGNTYTITYKPNYDGATESDVTQNVTYDATFTTKSAGTFHRPGYEMSGWSEPFTQMNHQYAYNIIGDTSLNAQWQMCTAGTYAGETETQCTNCPGEYPLSVAGASAIEQCYKNCSVPCTPVACPANSTCTQTDTTYNGTQYYGGACNAVPQNCEITEIICDAGFYLNGTVCEPCPNGTTSPAGSTNVNQCSACPDGQYVDNETCTDCPDGFNHSDANATSQSQCYHDCETPCTEPACPANSTSCTYGTNPNSGAWYFGTDACNATPLVCPIESATCAGGYGWNPTNNTCEPCTGNEASINNSCEPCPDGTQPNADNTACVPCADNEAGVGGVCNPCPDGMQPNADHTACEPCADNEAGVGGVCNPCPDGMQPNADHTACVPCADNEAGVGGVCNPCPDGTQPNADHTACEPCADNEAGVGGVCNPCPDGMQPNADHTACVPCADNEAGVGGVCNPCPDGTQPNADHTACEPCADNEAGLGGVCNPCPDGMQPNADHTACEPCPDGTAGTNGTCEPCAPGYVPNAQATACEPCPAGTYWENGICEPCPEDYSSAPGSVGLDACFLAACPAGQHIAHGACEDDVIICDAPYAATATRTWNSTLGAYGSCQIQECEDGYHVASNACVPNDQLCNVANGRGERIWNGTQWGNCVVTECDPGFEPNATNTACGRCGNYMGADGQPAVSSYIAGCEIATCMYQGQKYALENGECMPICEPASDDTGSKHWDNATKKCVRTCNPGYKMW